MKRSAIRQLNYYQSPDSFEKHSGESEVIPNQSLTVNEVLQRFQAGTLPDITKTPRFEDNPDFDTINLTESPDWDLADATSVLEIAQQRLATLAEKSDDLTPNEEQSEANETNAKE